MGKKIIWIFFTLGFSLWGEEIQTFVESDEKSFQTLGAVWDREGETWVIRAKPILGKAWVGGEVGPWVCGPLDLGGFLDSPATWNSLGVFSGLWNLSPEVDLARSGDGTQRYGVGWAGGPWRFRVQKKEGLGEGALGFQVEEKAWSLGGEVRVGRDFDGESSAGAAMLGWAGVQGPWGGLGLWGGGSWRAGIPGALVSARVWHRWGAWEAALGGGVIGKDFYFVRSGLLERPVWGSLGLRGEGAWGRFQALGSWETREILGTLVPLIQAQVGGRWGSGALVGHYGFRVQGSRGLVDAWDWSAGWEIRWNSWTWDARGAGTWKPAEGWEYSGKGTLSTQGEIASGSGWVSGEWALGKGTGAYGVSLDLEAPGGNWSLEWQRKDVLLGEDSWEVRRPEDWTLGIRWRGGMKW